MSVSEQIEIPARMRRLPRDKHGRVVPWFVAFVDGQPDHRIARGEAAEEALRFKLCWVCGNPLGANLTFVIGPMCVVNRVTAEPPAHRDCAIYSAQVRRVARGPGAHRQGIEAGVGRPRAVVPPGLHRLGGRGDRVHRAGVMTDEFTDEDVELVAQALWDGCREDFPKLPKKPSQQCYKDGRLALDALVAAGWRRVPTDQGHVIEFREDGWTISHPLSCRPKLFDCPVNRVAERELTEPPDALGRFECELNDIGDRLLIGDRVEGPAS